MTTFRVMKTNKFEDSVYYRVACSCNSEEHDVILELEIDEDIDNMIFLNFWKKIYWSANWKSNDNWFRNILFRIKGALKILFFGYLEFQEDFILEGEEHIDSFINALKEGKQFIKNKNRSNSEDK